MEKSIIICFVSILLSFTGYSQTDKGAQHVGVMGIPIVDIFNFSPENEISGVALNINYGSFVRKNLSVGLNIYSAGFSNEYGTEDIDYHRENQKIRLTGLNSNFRYYYSISENINIFSEFSIGFGYYKIETTNLSTSLIMEDGLKKESVLLIIPGVGLNYRIFNNLSLEFNLPYIFVKRFSTDPYAENSQTILPTLGIQYFWNWKN